jgi:predicted TIM-barrel fold metal-dependent hydrolase
MQYKRISADCHLDMIWLPSDLFTSQAPRDLKDRMPFVTDGPNGKEWVANNGASFGLVGGVGSAGALYVPGKQHRADRMNETGLYEAGKQGIRRPGDPDLRAKELDKDGVDAEVIYGVLAAAAKLSDAEASYEMLRIYNDFIIDFCKKYPRRMIGLACLPFGDVEAAAKEVRRVAKLGVKGVELSCSWNMQPMWHPSWNPLWEAINETQLPLHFHTFPSVDPKLRAGVQGEDLLALRYSSICLFQMTLGAILTSLMGAAVFERFPHFRVVFGESGIGWIPYLLDRMDYEYQDQYRDIKLKLLPSEYWRRQCRATFQFDRIGTKLIEDLGVETLMWGSDYPHPDGIWPDSSDYIAKQFGHLPADVTHKITCENAGKFYGLIN